MRFKESLNEKRIGSIEQDTGVQRFIGKYKDAHLDEDDKGYYVAIPNGSAVWIHPEKILKDIIKIKPKNMSFTNKWVWLRWE